MEDMMKQHLIGFLLQFSGKNTSKQYKIVSLKKRRKRLGIT
jgi:hypothetical protein